MNTRFPHFDTLKDWLHFCRQEDLPAKVDAEHVDEIQQAVRTLTDVLERHEDAQQLANLWFTVYGLGRWRLVSVVGKRTRSADMP